MTVAGHAIDTRRRRARSRPVHLATADEAAVSLALAHAAIHPVPTPRAARALLVIGQLPAPWRIALERVHDQVPPPRSSVWWGGDDDPWLPHAHVVPAGDDPTAAWPALAGAVARAGRGAGDPTIGADEPPTPFKGRGPHGQGGEGMIGGTPYGRPLATTAGDRDGLALDELPARIGPFAPMLPPGLTLDVTFHGDLVADLTAVELPPGAGDDAAGVPVADPDAVFGRALTQPVRLAEVELARARHHLRWLAGALWRQGATALAQRAARLAWAPELPRDSVVRRLHRLVRVVSGARPALQGLAPLRTVEVGPAGRAAGHAADGRDGHPAYRSLGFHCLTQRSGDTWDRWAQRLAETTQAIDLAARAAEGDVVIEPTGAVEAPGGPVSLRDRVPADPLPAVLGELAGREWSEVVAALDSLDRPVPLPPGAVWR